MTVGGRGGAGVWMQQLGGVVAATRGVIAVKRGVDFDRPFFYTLDGEQSPNSHLAVRQEMQKGF